MFEDILVQLFAAASQRQSSGRRVMISCFPVPRAQMSSMV
jgi:hypothetical protein